MSAISDISNRWSINSAVPCFIGAAINGTLPPYVVFTSMGSLEVRSSPNVVNWTEETISFMVVTSTSVESNDLSMYALQLFNMKSFGSVADMRKNAGSTYYTDNPMLTGSKGWVGSIDFTIKY